MSIYGTKIDWDGAGVYKGDESNNCKWCGDTGWMRTFGHDTFYNDAPCMCCKLGQNILDEKIKEEYQKELNKQHTDFIALIDKTKQDVDIQNTVLYICYRGFYYRWDKFYISNKQKEDWICMIYPGGQLYFSDTGRRLYESSI